MNLTIEEKEYLGALLKRKCNRLTNGSCHTHVCLTRGGWQRGSGLDYSVSTCIALEVYKKLKEAGHVD